MTTPKRGPLSMEDIQAIWEATNDANYVKPIIQAGEGHGFEVFTQMFAQFARASEAVDRTTQALFIDEWSGQTDEASAGEDFATVTVSLSRTGLAQTPLILKAGLYTLGELARDWSDNGGEDVDTTRYYVLGHDVVFAPGFQGPIDAVFVAERPGYGYNNPLPESIRNIIQPGAGLGNDRASVRVITPATLSIDPIIQVWLDAANEADTVVPDHVGRYVRFTAGSNVGQIALVTGYAPPQSSPPTGGSLSLAILQAFSSSTWAGTFQAGEPVTLWNGASPSGYGYLLDARVISGALVVTVQVSTGSAITKVTGNFSGAFANVTANILTNSFVAESVTAEWEILDYVDDFVMTASNAESPEGGRLGMLDALGDERNVRRAPGETDATYRPRVGTLADVVSPNALTRAIARSLDPLPWCFREVGSVGLPGLFFGKDQTFAATDFNGDAFDYDPIVMTGGTLVGAFGVQALDLLGGAWRLSEPVEIRDTATGHVYCRGYFGSLVGATMTISRIEGDFAAGTNIKVIGLFSGATWIPGSQVDTSTTRKANRFRLMFDTRDFRGFFIVGVPRLAGEDPGVAFDGHPRGAFDSAPTITAFDGGAFGSAAAIYAQLYQSLNETKAGGVGFALLLDDGPCP